MRRIAHVATRLVARPPQRGIVSTIQNLPYFTRLTKREESRKESESILREAFRAAASELDGPIPEGQREEAKQLWLKIGVPVGSEAPQLRSLSTLLENLDSHLESKRSALPHLVEPANPAAAASAHFFLRCTTLREVLLQLARGVARMSQKEADRSYMSFSSKLPATIIDDDVDLLVRFCRAWVDGSAMDRVGVHIDAMLKTSEDEWLPEPKALLAFETVYYGMTAGLISGFQALPGVPRRQSRLYRNSTRNYLRDDVEFPMKFRCCFAWAAADDPHPAVKAKPSLDSLARKEALVRVAEAQFAEEFSNASKEMQEEFKQKDEKYWASRVENRQYYGLSFLFLSTIFALDLYSMDI